MSYPFCVDLYDEHLEIITIADLECEVEVDVIVSGGDLSTDVTDVLISGRSLMRGDEVSRALGGRLAGLAEADIKAGGRLWDRIREAEGIIYRGLGGNDPDGHFVRAA